MQPFRYENQFDPIIIEPHNHWHDVRGVKQSSKKKRFLTTPRARYNIDTLMYKWHRYLRDSDYTYLLDNCLASSVYLRNFECGLSSSGDVVGCEGLPLACGMGGDLLRCDDGGDATL